jgi:hypothetical protein
MRGHPGHYGLSTEQHPNSKIGKGDSKSYTSGTAARASRERRIWQKNRVWDADNPRTSCPGFFLNPTHAKYKVDLKDYLSKLTSEIKRVR